MTEMGHYVHSIESREHPREKFYRIICWCGVGTDWSTTKSLVIDFFVSHVVKSTIAQIKSEDLPIHD